MTNRSSQNREILNYLKTGKSITQFEAVRLFGCYRLSARIHDLRDKGYDIKTINKVGKKANGHTCNYAEYTLVMTEPELMCEMMCGSVEE